MSEQSPYLMYVADPMCSWCWGFAPTLDKLLDLHDLPLRIVVGGLRPGDAARPLDETMQGHLKHHWEQVEQASGQPFNPAGLTRTNWLYDTEPAARAVLAMRELLPSAEYAFFKDLQQAFYKDAVDITDPASYASILEPYEVNGEQFLELMASPELKERTYQDFGLARHLGIQGFPSLLLGRGNELTMLSRGYQPFEQLSAVLDSQLKPIQLG